jgi:cephalosporin-C deacetylase-like acetyl esterase
MDGLPGIDLFVEELRERIDADRRAETAFRIIPGSAPEPLYFGLPGSPEAYTVELKRPDGIRPFCMRVLPGEREDLPLLVISPGYGGTLRDIPAELREYYTTIFPSPLGYGTADGGQADELRRYGIWPVLANTVHGEDENYADWLLDAAWGMEWAARNTSADTNFKIFAGCSQGGAMSVILGGVFRDTCQAVCADEPFLVDCSGERIYDFIATVVHNPAQIVTVSKAERNLANVDPMYYAPLLEGIPVLICSGSEDRQCPAVYNKKLFDALPDGPYNRYVVHKGRSHGYSVQFHRTMMRFLNGELP